MVVWLVLHLDRAAPFLTSITIEKLLKKLKTKTLNPTNIFQKTYKYSVFFFMDTSKIYTIMNKVNSMLLH
tara:strand:+ start:2758 stop:2967 length:210 start_codon:yes stop_codon:yes gene_type:complete